MTVNELIARLQKLNAGNIDVYLNNRDDEYECYYIADIGNIIVYEDSVYLCETGRFT